MTTPVRKYVDSFFEQPEAVDNITISKLLDENNYPYIQYGLDIKPQEIVDINWMIDNFYYDVFYVNRRVYLTSEDIKLLIKLTRP